MDLLFKREQTTGKLARVNFKLWGKIELDEEEQGLVRRYRFDESVLIFVIQPTLMRQAGLLGVLAFLLSSAFLSKVLGMGLGVMAGIGVGIGAAYWWINEKRETIYVRDLLHGRHFTCESIVDLARKEAWLENKCAVFRQVMESAKHWDGIERHQIEPLPKDEAKQVMLMAA